MMDVLPNFCSFDIISSVKVMFKNYTVCINCNIKMCDYKPLGFFRNFIVV